MLLQKKNSEIERNIERGCGVDLFDAEDKREIRNIRECNEVCLYIIDNIMDLYIYMLFLLSLDNAIYKKKKKF